MLNDFTFDTLVLVQNRSVVKLLRNQTAQKYMASEQVLIYILLILILFIFCRQRERVLENISASPIIFEFFMRNIIGDLFHHCKGCRDWFRKKNNTLYLKKCYVLQGVRVLLLFMLSFCCHFMKDNSKDS